MGNKIINHPLFDFYKEQSCLKDQDKADKQFQTWGSRDPWPDIPCALLNSEDILKYVLATGMICPFYPDNLSGASYEVSIGGLLIYWNENGKKIKKELKDDDTFILEKNTIAFITLEPKFQIPDYMALRFNLKIKHIYKGLLLGTGPLVDPGFVGKLSIPLHNLTANRYKFNIRDKLIKMEFTKLSENPAWSSKVQYRKDESFVILNDYSSKPRIVDDYITSALEGCTSVSIQSSIFDSMRKAESSAKNAELSVKKTEQSVKKWGVAGGLGVIIALAGLFIALYQIVQATNQIVQTTDSRINSLYEKIEQNQKELKSKIDTKETAPRQENDNGATNP
ncbi:hypothetical protein FACS1894137_07780 [Spirochaetia bacterium]|nr:hypothetical protein FACS1894137_07780 [Spirochaetia bacterium]